MANGLIVSGIILR